MRALFRSARRWSVALKGIKTLTTHSEWLYRLSAIKYNVHLPTLRAREWCSKSVKAIKDGSCDVWQVSWWINNGFKLSSVLRLIGILGFFPAAPFALTIAFAADSIDKRMVWFSIMCTRVFICESGFTPLLHLLHPILFSQRQHLRHAAHCKASSGGGGERCKAKLFHSITTSWKTKW